MDEQISKTNLSMGDVFFMLKETLEKKNITEFLLKF